MEAQTGRTPAPLAALEALEEALDDDDHAAIEAWGELSTSRPVTLGGAGGIPLTEIAAWFALRGLSPRWRLVERILTIDQAWLEHQAAQHDKRGKDAPRTGQGGRSA